MDDEPDLQLGFGLAPAHVSLTPFSPIPSPATRRLSSCFVGRSRPVPAARRLAWVSLQGRLVNAEEASSAGAVNGGLAPPEAAAWELFSPVHRFLIVAVIGVAVAESRKNGQISRLQKSVQLRDQVLSSMQQKLDSLCEQLNNVKDCAGTENVSLSFTKGLNLQDHEASGFEKTKFVDCGCWLCDQHHDLFNRVGGNSVTKASGEDAILRYKACLTNVAEQEERRMSDLSDWASSVTSAAEIQMNNLAIEQDLYNLKRDCEDKDAIIKELTTLLHSSDAAGSKRITELEDIIRRKNTIITRLKKDVVVLEQKVMNFARLRRPSFASSEPPCVQIPHMTDNLLYDMDSTTSPSSSSDSDTSPQERAQASAARTPEFPQTFESHSIINQKSLPPKLASSGTLLRLQEKNPKSRSVSPLKEISMNRKSEAVSSSRQRQESASADTRRSARRLHLSSQKDTTPHKRWV